MPRTPRGDMTVKEAGRIGGNAARLWSRAGHDVIICFSRHPDQLAARAAELGDHVGAASPAHAVADIGKVGGTKVKEKLGAEHYLEIGKKGGETVKEKYGSDYYKRIGKIGGEARKKRRGALAESA